MKRATIASIHMPYCIRSLGEDRWIILNRHYKPLGMFTERFIRYEDHPSMIFHAKADKIQKALQIEPNEDGSFYFYHGSDTHPIIHPQTMKRYIQLLERLAHLKIEQTPEALQSNQ